MVRLTPRIEKSQEARKFLLTNFRFCGLERETVGRRKIINEKNIEVVKLPEANDVLGIAIKPLGYDRFMVKCQDGLTRLCRIRGKLKRRVWVRVGDIVLVSPWDFQSETRGDIFWRYRRNQVQWLREKGYLTIEK